MAVTVERRRWDVLVVLTAPPHVTETFTAVLRLAQEVADAGRTIRVWACGYNTMLSQVTLGATKPVDLRAPDRPAPSAAALIARLVEDNGGRVAWIACSACSAERGAGEHIPQVRMRSDARLAATIAAADRSVYIGGA